MSSKMFGDFTRTQIVILWNQLEEEVGYAEEQPIRNIVDVNTVK